MSNTTRKTLLSKIRACDTIGWQEFYEIYKIPIVAMTNKYGWDSADTPDLIQQVMLAVFNNGKFSYDPEKGTKFRAWLGTITRNKMNDMFRKKCRKDKNTIPVSRKDKEDSDMDIPVDEFEKKWAAEYAKHVFAQAMEQLKLEVEPATYQAFEMLTIQGASASEVADATGISVDNIYLLKNRCINRLKRIKKELDEE